ncbi:MAG: hypothetical protein J6Z38_00280 [Lachnospiraceae bacterium]|nr:hypothetical protein [Lachnospiraceae bacterium]
MSRSKVLRVESTGLIAPACRGGRANSRHYDAMAALKLKRILLYQNLGHTADQTVRYFNGEVNFEDAIAELEDRIHELTVALNAMKIRVDATQHLVVQETTTVPCYYYARETRLAVTAQEAMNSILDATAEAIGMGYTLRSELPMTCINVAPMVSGESHPLLCIPIINEVRDEHVIFLPREEKKCVHWYGKASEENYISEYLKLLLKRGIGFDETSRIRCEILSYPLDVKLPRKDSWVLRFYLPD